MALNQHVQDHLDKRAPGITYTTSGNAATITSTNVSAQRLTEIELAASQVGHEVVISGGSIKVQPR